VEVYRVKLEAVKAELAPWEKQIKEVQARIDVAASERNLLIKQQIDAKQRLADTQLTLKAAHETARSKAQQIKEMEAAVGKHRCAARCGVVKGTLHRNASAGQLNAVF
jgi:chromosome segregation ATPase